MVTCAVDRRGRSSLLWRCGYPLTRGSGDYMIRPACPACSDNYSVAKVSAIHHSVTYGYDSLSSDDLDPTDVYQAFAPPAPPGRLGRYLAVAVAAGLTVCVASGFSVIWLYISLCIGVVAEMMNHWEQLQARDDYRRALARWKGAYFCGRHTLVFIVGERGTYSPGQFALQVRGSRQWAPIGARPPAEPHPAPGGLSSR